MSVEGKYELILTCNGDRRGECATTEIFTHDTRMEAKQLAREAGWMLSQRDSKAYCPSHANDRRASWRLAG